MSAIDNINRITPGLIEQPGAGKTVLLEPERNKEAKFTELFTEMLNSVDGLQKDSAALQTAFQNGEPVELHQIMIKAEEAGIAMDLLLEIRNKLINAYNDIMRMPI